MSRHKLRSSGQGELQHQAQALAKVLLAILDTAIDVNVTHQVQKQAVLGGVPPRPPQLACEFASGSKSYPSLEEVEAFDDDPAEDAVDTTGDEVKSDSSLDNGGSTPKVERPDCRRAVQTLKADIDKILHREPHWEIFTEDFRVIDETGARLHDLESCKVHLQTFRTFPNRFSIKDNLQFFFLDGQDFENQSDPLLAARWKVRLGGVTIEFLRFFNKNVPVNVEVEAMFHFTDKSQVDYMQLQSILVNGVELQEWLAHGDGAPPGIDVALARLQLLKSNLIEALKHAQVYAIDARKRCATAYTYVTSGEGSKQCQRTWSDVQHAVLAVFVHAMAMLESSKQLVLRGMGNAAVKEELFDRLDINHDGTISREEFRQALSNSKQGLGTSIIPAEEDAMNSHFTMTEESADATDDADEEMIEGYDDHEIIQEAYHEAGARESAYDFAADDNELELTPGPMPAELSQHALHRRERDRYGLLR